MNLRQLNIFRVVCEEQSFTRTAERLFMTQPAVSRTIAELEEESELVLFDRLSKKIYLTEAGKLFLEKALHVLDAFEDLRMETRRAEGRAVLRIVSSITIAVTYLPVMIKEMERRRPETVVNVRICSAAEAERCLAANDADLALIEGDAIGEGWEKKKFSSYKMAFFCSAEDEFAGRTDIRPEELARRRLLLREKGSAIRDTLDSVLLLLHLKAEPAWTSTNSQAIIEAVKKNIGISLLPEELLAEGFRDGSLRSFDVRDMRLANNSYIVTHREKHWTEAMRTLGDIAVERGQNSAGGRRALAQQS